MTKLFIANATAQHHIFMYRLPDTAGQRHINVPAGGQVQIPGDLTPFEIEAILTQHKHYGLVSLDEISRTKPFAGLCYSLDRPIKLEKIQELVTHNQDVLRQRGRDLRAQAAVATSSAIEERLAENRMPDTLERFDVQVEEMSRDHRDESPEINEGVEVVRHAAQATPGAVVSKPSAAPPRRR